LRKARFVGSWALPVRKKRHDSWFEFVFSQLRGRGNADLTGELLQLIQIPIAVRELLNRHCWREFVCHKIAAERYRSPAAAASETLNLEKP
jgi:hypothetical protein